MQVRRNVDIRRLEIPAKLVIIDELVSEDDVVAKVQRLDFALQRVAVFAPTTR